MIFIVWWIDRDIPATNICVPIENIHFYPSIALALFLVQLLSLLGKFGESIGKKLDVFEQSSACSRFSSWPKSHDTLGWLKRQTNSSINAQRAIALAFRSESLFCRRTKSTLSVVHTNQWTGNRDNKIENEPCLTLILIDCFVWLSARRIHTIFTPWNVRSM